MRSIRSCATGLTRMKWGLAVVALSCLLGSAGTRAAEPTTVTMFTYAFPVFIIQRVTAERGYYKDEGLDVKFIVSSDGSQVTRLIAAGQGYGAQGSAGLPLASTAKGLEMRVLASYLNENIYEIYARKDSGLPFNGSFREKVQALKGKIVGVTGLGAALDIVAQSIIRAGGLDPDRDVTRLGVGAAETQIAQLKAGRIDAFVNAPPASAMLRHAGLGDVYISADELPPAIRQQATLVAYTSRSQFEANPKLAERWVAAERKGVQWMLKPENFDAVAAIMKREFLPTLDDAIVRETTRSLLKGFATARPSLQVPKSAIGNTRASLEQFGLIPAKPAASLEYNDLVVPFARE